MVTQVPVEQVQSNVDLSAIDHEIKGAVVDNFLSAKPHTSDVECFTSSDTVSELLKGFADEAPDKSGNPSLEDAVQILPSFAKALNSYTCQGKDNFAFHSFTFFFFIQIKQTLHLVRVLQNAK